MTNTPMRNQYRSHPDWYFTGDTLPSDPFVVEHFVIAVVTDDGVVHLDPHLVLGEN